MNWSEHAHALEGLCLRMLRLEYEEMRREEPTGMSASAAHWFLVGAKVRWTDLRKNHQHFEQVFMDRAQGNSRCLTLAEGDRLKREAQQESAKTKRKRITAKK
jgi:hypothetical protein